MHPETPPAVSAAHRATMHAPAAPQANAPRPWVCYSCHARNEQTPDATIAPRPNDVEAAARAVATIIAALAPLAGSFDRVELDAGDDGQGADRVRVVLVRAVLTPTAP